MRQHLAAQVADLLAPRAELDDGVGSVGEVDDGAGEGFVERAIGVAEAGEAGGRLEGGFEGLAADGQRLLRAVLLNVVAHTCPRAMKVASVV